MRLCTSDLFQYTRLYGDAAADDAALPSQLTAAAAASADAFHAPRHARRCAAFLMLDAVTRLSHAASYVALLAASEMRRLVQCAEADAACRRCCVCAPG